jgi:taurine dioxygenase
MSLTIEPLTPLIGAEIKGVDVTKITTEEFVELFQAFTDHSVIFMRDQPQMNAEEHTLFAKRFGEIHIHPAARGKPAEHPGYIRMRTDSQSRVAAGNRWHSDVSCDAKPPQASILQLHQIPPLGGDTLFSSLYAAYHALSDPMKLYLDGLTALHSGEEPFRHVFEFKADDESARWPENHHPIVRKHSDSGRPALFVDREFTKSIDVLPKEEGKALLEFLFSHIERVDFQCRFRWSENAIAIWDNRCALHHALWDYYPEERRGRRISVVGEEPLAWRHDANLLPASDFARAKLTI